MKQNSVHKVTHYVRILLRMVFFQINAVLVYTTLDSLFGAHSVNVG